MGLAATQARLLTITTRKSDCEFRSMSLSNEKLSLAREQSMLSNRYSSALDKTKLVYDYYGTGDETEQLSYKILMTPSILNNYVPTLLTNQSDRVILNEKYAKAAREAGIGQEGVGSPPSVIFRNKFIQALRDCYVIDQSDCDKILGTTYLQSGAMEDQSNNNIATFYDLLLNQIAINGWTENAEITDNSYLQKMLQNGMMFVTTVCDKNTHLQENYSTWTYVKEITDESAVSKAESEYNTEKQKLNSKEQKLDIKMKNLDTEMSSLNTEYDTVKNLISKNIEKYFKRYNA